MKKNILLFVAAVMAFASCGRKVDYEHMTFATLDAASYSFNEDVEEFRVPVTIVNRTGAEVAVSFKTVDGKAQEGVDYEVISPVSGVLSFAPGETTQEIVLGINYDPDLTGTKDFSLTIASATEGFIVGGCNTTKLRIKDDNHPLKAFIGEWTASATGYLNGIGYGWSMIIEPDESDLTYTKLIIYDLEPLTAYLGYDSENGYNMVEAVAQSDKQLVVEVDSYLATDVDAQFEQDGVFSVACLTVPKVDQFTGQIEDVKIDLSDDGNNLTIANALTCLFNGSSIVEIVEGPLVFTKK